MSRIHLKSLLCAGAALAIGLGALPAAAQTPIPPGAKDFAMMAAQSDEYEIQTARTAVAESQDPRIRAFARQMIEDHTRTSESLDQAARASGLPQPPKAVSADQSRMLSALQSLRGPDFDQAYARQQVLAHSQALAVEESYAAAGSDPNLRAVADAGAPLIRGHLDMARQLSASLGGS